VLPALDKVKPPCNWARLGIASRVDDGPPKEEGEEEKGKRKEEKK